MAPDPAAAGPHRRRGRRADALRDFGDTVEALGGSYVTAEDVGTSSRDMQLIASVTRPRDRPLAPPRRLRRPEPVDGARRRVGDPRLLRARLRDAVAGGAHDRDLRPGQRRRARRDGVREGRRDAARHRHRRAQARARRRARRALGRARRGARRRRSTSSRRARSAACSTTRASRGSARRSSRAPRTTSSPTTTSPSCWRRAACCGRRTSSSTRAGSSTSPSSSSPAATTRAAPAGSCAGSATRCGGSSTTRPARDVTPLDAAMVLARRAAGRGRPAG